MEMRSIQIKLEPKELGALYAMSEADCRPMRDQVRHLIRVEAERRNLLVKKPPENHEEEIEGRDAAA